MKPLLKSSNSYTLTYVILPAVGYQGISIFSSPTLYEHIGFLLSRIRNQFLRL